MAATITQALVARFDAFAPADFQRLPNNAGGLWLDDVPSTEAPVLPIAGLVHQGETIEYTFETEYFEKGSFEITVFALGVAEAERLGLLVKAAIDPCIKHPGYLAITNATVISFERVSGDVGVETFRQEDGMAVGRVSMVYGYTVQRSLPT